MKSYSAEALAALDSGEAIVAGAVDIALSPALRLWSGHGSVTLDGQPFKGVGGLGQIHVFNGALGGEAQGIELTLSGLDPDIVSGLDLAALRGVSVVIWCMIWNGTGTRLLDARVWRRGTLDTSPMEAVPGGTSTIRLGVEGAARGLGRRSERMRSDADQRLISATDGGFRRVVHAGEKTIYFGGQKPQRAGTALGASPDADLLSRMKR